MSTIFSLTALWYVLVFVYAIVCAALIFVIILQKGKGVGFAGAFGIGPGSETIFGPRGSKSVPVRMTYIGATLFMVLAFLLSVLAGHVGQSAAPEVVTAGSAEEAGLQELESLGLGGETGGTPGATAPATETPAPAEQPAPADAAATPAPAAEAPAPAAEAPAPATEAPAPAEQPAPGGTS